MMDKSPEAFRTISEVADDLDLPQHVLRFWETRFPQIKPLKRGGGRRYYRPDDIDLLRGIRRLLYGEGYTIKGVQRILRDQGLRHVAALGRASVLQAAAASMPPEMRPVPAPPALGGPELYAPPAERALAARGADPNRVGRRHDFPEPEAEPTEDGPQEAEAEEHPAPEVRPPVRDLIAEQPAPFVPPVAAPPPVLQPPPEVRTEPQAPAPPPRVAPPPPVVEAVPPAPLPPVPEIPPPRPQVEPPRRSPLPRRDPEITAEGLRRLRATLFELTECKRLLDEVR